MQILISLHLNCVRTCPYNRGRNVTLIGAISQKAFLAPFTFEGWTNQEAFLTYVTKVLVPQLWSGACVIMDNLSAHKATAVREAIESVGDSQRLDKTGQPSKQQINYGTDRSTQQGCPVLSDFFPRARVEFLSPYSPDFNPIENCWSKVKEFLRSCESRTYPELDQAITEAINLVTEKDLIGWFTHCCYYRLPN